MAKVKDFAFANVEAGNVVYGYEFAQSYFLPIEIWDWLSFFIIFAVCLKACARGGVDASMYN